MGCNCGKKKPAPVVVPAPEPEPETTEQFHAKEMDKWAKQIQDDSEDLFNNLDTITPIEDL